MGAYAPIALVDEHLSEQLTATVMQPVVDVLAESGDPFVGVLYAGLMLTEDGPRVLEFNARWGDPEAQVLLPLLESDLVEIMLACIEGRLSPDLVHWRDNAALGVVLAAEGYPGRPRTGDPVILPDTLPAQTLVFHAGTAERNGQIVTAGGRVLTAVGLGATLEQAHQQAYALADQIMFAGRQMRHDIGWRSLGRGV
jgi:phosphoribosylamine--glycine ligase